MAGKPSGPSMRSIPEGDNRERLVCPDCGFVSYDNPKVVVGSVALWQGKILLCRRAIPPRTGLWTLPAGYLELNETTEAGAAREAWEEARARISIDGLLAVYNIPRISQIQLIYRARLTTPDIAAGEESLEVGLFDWADIPWSEIAFPSVERARAPAGRSMPPGPTRRASSASSIAFPSVEWALAHYRESAGGPLDAPRTNPPGALGDLE